MGFYSHTIHAMHNKQSFVIQGLGEDGQLQGKISVNGAKNAALKAIAASLLFEETVLLQNVPDTDDVQTIIKIMQKLGAKVQRTAPNELSIDPSAITGTDIDADLAKTMRASVVLTGPLFSRFGKLTFPAPGGCVIGARPIDLFIEAYGKMGAKVTEESNLFSIQGQPKGTEIFFDKISVGATETMMMAAVLGRGTFVLKNCAQEPEIVNVAEWLNACGADIQGVGTSTIVVKGREGKLLKAKKPYRAIPDRIEAGSFVILGALLAKDLTVENCEPSHLESLISLLRGAGVAIETTSNAIKVCNQGRNQLKAFNVITHEYPGFPTDLQAPLAVFLSQAKGESIVFETIFEGRFKYIEELIKMGADITVMNSREILIKGPTVFKVLPEKEELNAHDIRAGFAVVLAALCASGTFVINNAHLIDRGYEKLEERLSSLGATIKRV